MKNVVIVHGWTGSPDEPLHRWLKQELESVGYSVVVPKMPNADEPKISEWIGKLNEVVSLGNQTILVGHSIGCQAILRYLEKLSEGIPVGKVILIAPWMELDQTTIEEEGEESIEIARPWVETPINFKKAKKHANRFIAIFSDNDPFVPLSQKNLFERELGAEIIVEHGMGHFSPDDNVSELQSALDAIVK